MPILRPAPSWSVLLRRRVTVSPSLPNVQSSTSKPTSSDRRNAPANPSNISARSRAPISPASAASTIARMSSVSVGDLGAVAVPSVRRMPLIGIDHDHRRALLARHDRGRQARGSCPDDDHIDDLVKMNLAASALCGGLFGQDGCTGANGCALLEEISAANRTRLFVRHLLCDLS
jgi:hypothetical protein